jgi:phosphoribosylformylglycinamidine synthase II
MLNTIEITDELVARHGLKPDEYQRILDLIKRAPTFTELGIFSAMWNEHCSYKSSRLHLKGLPTSAPWVIQGPGENAGVVDIGDGEAVIFKMESHNHPSFIEPYQGAATGVGGILRDVFTMGARPVAALNALRFGDPSHPRTRHLVSGVVAGIGGYGNAFGVPTVGGLTGFHSRYNSNILVNAMAVGIAQTNQIFYAKATGIGNPIVYLGSKTGRDGIHGATMASAEFDEASGEKRPTVQVGDPFAEKLLLEACLELMASGAVIAIQDMGAAGLTCSAVEMGAKGGLGVELNLDHVPTRETNMTAYEMMLSESQERMLMVLDPVREAEAQAIFRKWGLDFAVIGHTTGTLRFVVKHKGETMADLPIMELGDEAPLYDRPWVETPKRATLQPDSVKAPASLSEALVRIIGSPNMASKRWIWEQYDHLILGNSIVQPGSDAAVVRIGDGPKGIAMTADVNPLYCEADPFEGGKQAVAEAWRNLVASGAQPLAVTDNLNFGNPERPEIMGQLVGCLKGIGAACTALDFPVVSGNVSLYNETSGQGILPTPTIGGVGVVADVARATTLALRQPDERLILIGETAGWLGCSTYLNVVENREEGAPPPVDLRVERRNGECVRDIIRTSKASAVHDLSEGGLILGLAEMALAGNVGATLENKSGTVPLHAWAFGEDQARYLLSVPAEHADAVLAMAKAAHVPAQDIGFTGGDALVLPNEAPLALDKLRHVHENWLPDFMGK